MEDDVKLIREVIQIEGGRTLYRYTFEVQGSAEGILTPAAQGSDEPVPEE